MNEKRVRLHLSSSQKYLPARAESTVYLMLKIVQPTVKINSDRLPLNISFVLDRSGSMAGPKLRYTKEAVQFAVKNLGNADRFSLVIFDNQVNLLIPSTLAENKDQLAMIVDAVYSGGTTNLSGGLLEGVNQVKKYLEKDLVNRVILLTDGLANVGITDTGRLTGLAREINSGGIAISTLGVGDGFNEDLLVEMAEASKGNFYYIDTPDSIPAIFKKELTGLLNVTGQNPILQVNPASGVKVNAVLGYEPTWNRGALIKLPDIYNGDSKTVLLEIQVNAGAPGIMPLGNLEFSYYDVTADLAKVSYSLQVKLEVTTNPDLVENGMDLTVKKEVELFKTAQAREEALREADRVDYESARQILYKRKQRMNKLFLQNDDRDLYACIAEVDADMMDLNPARYSPSARKNMKQKSYKQRWNK